MTGDPSRREARARGGRSPAEREHHGGDVFLVSAVVVIVSPAPRFSAATANAPTPRALQAHDAVRRRGRRGATTSGGNRSSRLPLPQPNARERRPERQLRLH